MKPLMRIDMKSLGVGVLLGALAVLSMAAASSTGSVVFEYRVVTGNVFQGQLGANINSSVAEGWEFISASGPNEQNWGIAVLKRVKK